MVSQVFLLQVYENRGRLSIWVKLQPSSALGLSTVVLHYSFALTRGTQDEVFSIAKTVSRLGMLETLCQGAWKTRCYLRFYHGISCQCILSIFPAGANKFYANILLGCILLKYYSPIVAHGETLVWNFLSLVNRPYAVIHKTQKS